MPFFGPSKNGDPTTPFWTFLRNFGLRGHFCRQIIQCENLLFSVVYHVWGSQGPILVVGKNRTFFPHHQNLVQNNGRCSKALKKEFQKKNIFKISKILIFGGEDAHMFVHLLNVFARSAKIFGFLRSQMCPRSP